MNTEIHFFLIGDVGATNSRLSLRSCDKSNEKNIAIVKEQTYKSNVERSLEDVIRKFLSEFQGKKEYPKVACLALAGPLIDGTVKITNVPNWPLFNISMTKKSLGIPEIKILNDFEANGYGILGLDLKVTPTLNSAVPQEGAPKAFIGTGTGLGEGIATKGIGQSNYCVFPGEGGHVDFAARNELEFGLLMFAKNRYNIERVSVERCCCGLAIGLIYEYLLEHYQGKKSSVLFEENNKDLSKITNEMIFESALQEKDEICKETLKLFASIYGSESGNLCLKILPYGGLFLMSGITTVIKDYLLKDPTFISNFLNKGERTNILQKIPIYLADDQAGMRGSEYYVVNNLL